jgi:2,5-dioxopentanoate dehydrogenase
MEFTDATIEEIDEALQKAEHAFHIYRKYSLKQRANFMRVIAKEIDALGDALLTTAGEETNLPEARLRGERARTMFQLTSYADACERGDWLDIRIDTANAAKTPPKPDIRKMLVPLGTVVVFGAANFPFAYSTAGGDTASAFAAGCPVIVKAHPAHARTSELVAGAILSAAQQCGLPDGIFTHIHGAGFEVGRALVEHKFTKAVGFTGSHAGGRQLFDWANQRKEPIPVFAEMSSINPVFVLPEKMKSDKLEVAKAYAGSITLGVGQFCTNPGLLIGIDNEDLQEFINSLGDQIAKVPPADMLNTGIFKNYVEKRANMLAQENVEMVAVTQKPLEGIDHIPDDFEATKGSLIIPAMPTLASATAQAFLNNPILHQEVFGPYSMVIRCRDIAEMQEVASHLEGQLTTTIMATDAELSENISLLNIVENKCGRFILNGVPTGVEVCLSMQHGGPYPATTDSRFTSVGADAMKRFARPLAYQNWSDNLLPPELQNANPLGLWRTVNDQLTRDAV